ncbi:MAG: hypothetical protein QOE33_3343 [Acidobacteriota bacterium]|nr:hypothetical protein [Acidobacteriota bacterium]
MGAQFLIKVFTVGVLAGASLPSCRAPQSRAMQNSEPSFVGFVTAIERGGDGEVVGRVTVESHANKIVNRHFVNITKQTVMLRREGETDRPISLDALQPKDWVKLWFADAAREPYPPDVTARQLLIVDRP